MRGILFCFFSLVFGSGSRAQIDSLEFYLKKGREAYTGGSIAGAYQAYKQALVFNPNHPDALKGMANAARDLQYFGIAREAYKKILQVQPGDTLAIIQSARMAFQTRQWADAINLAQKAKAQNLGKENDYIIGRSYYETGEPASAIEYLNKAWKQDSTDADLAFTLARCYVAADQYTKASQMYEAALRYSPNQEEWMYEAAMTYSAIPDEKNAARWFEAAVQKGYPRSRDLMYNMAVSYMGIKSYDKVVALANELLVKDARDPDMLYLAGEANFRLNKTAEAIQNWNQLLAIDPRQARALFMTGIATMKLGDKTKGMQLCDQAIAIDPSLSDLKVNISQFGL